MRRSTRTALVWATALAALVAVGPTAAWAQDDAAAGQGGGTAHIGPQHPVETNPDAPNREGFTMLLSLGFGVQAINQGDRESDTFLGVSVLNLGLGGFFNPSVALLFRTMGVVTFEEPFPGVSLTRLSAVAGPAVQFWPADFVRLEAGFGFGLLSREASAREGDLRVTVSEDEGGFGLLFGAGFAVWQNRNHALLLGAEYAPAFIDGTIHSLGLTFGWQLL